MTEAFRQPVIASEHVRSEAGLVLEKTSSLAQSAIAAQISGVAGIAVDSAGSLYIADKDNGLIRKVDATGNITTIAGGGTSTADGVMATNAAHGDRRRGSMCRGTALRVDRPHDVDGPVTLSGPGRGLEGLQSAQTRLSDQTRRWCTHKFGSI